MAFDRKRYSQEYYRKNRKSCINRIVKWQKKNKDKINFKRREKYKVKRRDHPEEFRAIWKENYKKYRDKVKDKNKKWMRQRKKTDPMGWAKQKERDRLKAKYFYDKDNSWVKIKKWRNKYPEKIKAQRLTQKKIQLKDKCDMCGDNNGLCRHHWRYDKPLLVNTLCRTCHQIQHLKDFKNSRVALLSPSISSPLTK